MKSESDSKKNTNWLSPTSPRFHSTKRKPALRTLKKKFGRNAQSWKRCTWPGKTPDSNPSSDTPEHRPPCFLESSRFQKRLTHNGLRAGGFDFLPRGKPGVVKASGSRATAAGRHKTRPAAKNFQPTRKRHNVG